MNEMQSLMGSLVLKHLEEVIRKRAVTTELYRCRLKDVPGIHLPPPLSPDITFNHAYMPIEVDEQELGMSRDALYEKLKEYNIYSRRYFYPLVCDYACYRSVSVKDPLTVARRVSESILTLPIYDSLQLSDVEAICEIIESIQTSNKTFRMAASRS